MAAAAAPILTLDILEIQVIVEYPLDAGGFYWHHRILLKKVSNGIWLTLTPDHDVVRHDFNSQNHLVLDRNSGFPRAQAPYVYAFDPISRALLESKKRSAQSQAVILGDEELVEVAQMVWVVADKRHASFGDIIPADIMDSPLTAMAFDSKGVAVYQGEEVHVSKMLASEVEDFKKGGSSDDRDMRLLGVHMDKSGKRRLELEDAMVLMSEETLADFPLGGDVRAVKEFVQSVSDGPGSLARYHVDWLRLSGINDSSSITHTHRNLCEALRMMISYDQVNPCNLASAEYLVRWLIMVETAVERNPRSPDFHGLSLIMGGPTTAEGKAVTSKFSEYLTSKLKERATVWKQERLYREELRHQAAASSSSLTGGGKPTGGKPGGGKGKGKSDKKGETDTTGGKGKGPAAQTS